MSAQRARASCGIALAALVVLVVAAPTPAAGQVSLAQIGGFERPLLVAQGARGPLVVVEQPGRVMARVEGSWRPFLDLRGRTRCCGEQGLLGLAFPPDYAQTRRFYVNHINGAGNTIVAQYRARPNFRRARPASRRVLLRIRQPYANHNGGHLAFDAQGRLYIGTGDGGSAGDPENRAQDLRSWHGKILRIRPAPRTERGYVVPKANPLRGRPGRNAILSWGLRNPWRFSLERVGNGQRLMIADVGQASWEEVNDVGLGRATGGNFGWSRYEGNAVFNGSRSAPDPIFPVHVYARSGGRCSVTGGLIARDPRFSRLRGRYLFGDFCDGRLRSFARSNPGQARDEGVGVAQLSSFGEGRARGVYMTDLQGPVYRVVER